MSAFVTLMGLRVNSQYMHMGYLTGIVIWLLYVDAKSIIGLNLFHIP